MKGTDELAGALLSFSTTRAALLVMVPLAFAGWLVMVAYLVLAAIAASQGGFRKIPAWACSTLVT
jgi:type IV secretory pathway VirB3-like protein